MPVKGNKVKRIRLSIKDESPAKWPQGNHRIPLLILQRQSYTSGKWTLLRSSCLFLPRNAAVSSLHRSSVSRQQGYSECVSTSGRYAQRALTRYRKVAARKQKIRISTVSKTCSVTVVLFHQRKASYLHQLFIIQEGDVGFVRKHSRILQHRLIGSIPAVILVITIEYFDAPPVKNL